MGFLGSIFKKPEPKLAVNLQKIEVKLSDLPSWIKETNSQKISSVKSELSGLWSDLLDQIAQLKVFVKELESAAFEKNDKTYAVVNMTKDLFVKKYSALNKIPKPLGETFYEIENSYKMATSSISEINQANAKQVYIISTYFRKESDQVVKTMKTMGQILSVFSKKLNSEGTILFVLDEISIKSGEIKGLEKEVADTEKELLEKSEIIKNLGSELISEKNNLNTILSDKKWGEIEESKKELNGIESEISKLSYSLSEDFSSIKRPLKKILHEAQLPKEQRIVLSQDLDLQNLDSIYPFFLQINKTISENMGPIKESEIEKITALKDKISSGDIESRVNLLRDLDQQKNEKESNFKTLIFIEEDRGKSEAKIKSAESSIGKLSLEITDLETRKKRILEQIRDSRISINRLLKEQLSTEIVIRD